MSVAIEIVELSHHYKGGESGGSTALKNLNFQALAGRSTAVLGPNGAGKTTLLKLILGLLQPSSGQIKVMGHVPGSPKARAATGFLSELPMTYNFMSQTRFLEYFQTLRKQTASTELQPIIEDLIQGLPKDQPMGQYSKGMKQRLNLARVLLGNPEIVFLDEPATGLDPIGQMRITRVANALQKSGKTLWINTHSIDFALQTADQVLILSQGRVAGLYDAADEGVRSQIENLFLSLQSERS